MTDAFSSHSDYMAKVQAAVDARGCRIDADIREAFRSVIVKEECEVVDLGALDVQRLASIFEKNPSVVKAVLSTCNIAARAIERDLAVKNFDTYSPRFSGDLAARIAAYIKPFLPNYIPVATLCTLDRIAFIDKEVRKGKGSWEKSICDAANVHGAPRTFKKTKFASDGKDFELDAAARRGDAIEVGIDVKRCEAPRDKHKRIDEIVNKASKYKATNPSGKFGAIVYYPFPDDQADFRARALSANIDGLVFANDDEAVVDVEVRALLEIMGVAAPVPPTGGGLPFT